VIDRGKVGNFYVLAPQTDTPQGTVPFLHDHVVATAPAQNQGEYRVILHGYFVFCSAQGLASGACVPTMTAIEGFGTVPFAETVRRKADSHTPLMLRAYSGWRLSPLRFS
jgi:hypothetical protein